MKKSDDTVKSPKRTRSDGSTPKEHSSNKRRKEKEIPRTLFGHVLVAMTKMIIIHSNYPEVAITNEESEKINDILLQGLEKDLAQNFKEIRHTDTGVLHVLCLDDESKQWVQKVVPTIWP